MQSECLWDFSRCGQALFFQLLRPPGRWSLSHFSITKEGTLSQRPHTCSFPICTPGGGGCRHLAWATKSPGKRQAGGVGPASRSPPTGSLTACQCSRCQVRKDTGPSDNLRGAWELLSGPALFTSFHSARPGLKGPTDNSFESTRKIRPSLALIFFPFGKESR